MGSPHEVNNIKSFYTSDDYIVKNPSIHEEDTPWKLSKILPLVDAYMKAHVGSELRLLDIGGGAGLILKGVAEYIERKFSVRVRKYAMDLSPGMLSIQQENNPDMTAVFLGDICETTLPDNEFDLTLMIDVLEHVPQPELALRQLRRISKFVIYKVPLELNLLMASMDLITLGKTRRKRVEQIGHINIYYAGSLLRQLGKYGGHPLVHAYTNAYEYTNGDTVNFSRMNLPFKLISRFCEKAYKFAPWLSALISQDFLVVLVKS